MNQIVSAILGKVDTKSQCKLPQLTQDEKDAAIKTEKLSRALKYRTKPELITLSAEATERILQFAQQRKASYLKTKEYWDKINADTAPILLAAGELKTVFIARASHIARKEFVIDKFNEAILDKLFHYFTASGEAEKLGMNLNKGIMLMGGLGTGKSTIMRAFATNQHTSFRLMPCMHLTYDFVEHGFSIIKDHSKVETIARNQYWQTERGVCYDDLGTEEERKRYGDKVNAMAEILMNRYDQVPHNMTHITTNLNAQDIEKYYGPRVRSRMREMFNILTFDLTAPDRRR
ncbi:MAG: hypothetical protein Q8J88_01085 [Bacteroidales bacterium]|nr:hypothetical protein [Bacteroidales bacterium]